MAHSDLTKQASLQDIARDAVQAAGKTFSEIDLRNHPFRSLFKVLAPAALWLGGARWAAIILGIAEEFIGGASILGDWIDRALGFGGGAQGSISDASLKGAAEGALDRLLGTTMERSTAFRERILKRGYAVEIDDLLAAWAAGPDKTMYKEAGAFSNWFRWLRQTGKGKRLPLVAMLYQLLKTLVLGLGIHAGIKFVRQQVSKPKPFGLPFGLPGLPGKKEPAAPSGARMDPAAGFAEWESVGGVERSIITALDKAVKDRRGRPFSALFAEVQRRPLRGSPAMRRLLEDIRAAHGWAPLRELDRSRYFLAPPIAEVARRLLPQLKYSPRGRADITDIEKRLGRILGGGKQ